MTNLAEINLVLLKQFIPQLKNALSIELIHKGVSTDKKIIVHLANNAKLLLRLFDLSELNHKQAEYDAITALTGFSVKCCRPLAFGLLGEYKLGYMLLSFIEGDDAKDELMKLSESEQYTIGLETGKQLRLIHKLKAPANIAPWYERVIEEHKTCMAEYESYNVGFKHEMRVKAFINEHIQYLMTSPNVFLHEDIHPGNVIIQDGQFSGIIDFNRYEWGDPVRDFLKMGMFSKSLSVPFCIGQVNGYHHNEKPAEAFWIRYSLYLAMSLFSSIVWIWKLEPHDKERIMAALDLMMEDQHNFDSYVPAWYR